MGIVVTWTQEFFCLNKKFLVFNLINRNLKNKYQRNVFGFLWTVLSPLALAATYYLVFKRILNIQIPHYLPFILMGTLCWNFFSQSLSEGVMSLSNNSGLLKKVPIPLQVFPFVGTTTNWITLIMASPVVVLALWLSNVTPSLKMLIAPLFLIFLHLIAYSIASILSIFYVFFRDLHHLVGITLNLWFYATPILYREDLIPEDFRFLLWLNPLGFIFKGLHSCLIYGSWPTTMEMTCVVIWTFVFMIISIGIRRFFAKYLIEQL